MFSQPESIDSHSPPPLRSGGPIEVGAIMLWLEHPRYIPARDGLIKYLQSTSYRFRRLPPVLFLCGGAGSKNRDALRDYLLRHAADLSLFYAERAWDQLASRNDRSALKMESDLALLADLVVIIVESPGTFAELGAFSLSDPLRKKVLAIVDEQYRTHQSFISTGPLRWIDRDSAFAPTIYARFPRILEVIDQIEERIARIPTSHSARLADLSVSPKHLLFFICDLVAVIHPAPIRVIEYYVYQIAPSVALSAIDIPTLVSLAVAMELLTASTVTITGDLHTLYSPADSAAVEHPYHHTRLLDMQGLRAAHASVLLSIPETRIALEEVAKSA